MNFKVCNDFDIKHVIHFIFYYFSYHSLHFYHIKQIAVCLTFPYF